MGVNMENRNCGTCIDECERYMEKRMMLADKLQIAGRMWSLGGIQQERV